MFWKWKRKSSSAKADDVLFEAPAERRSAYRVEPDSDSPVTLQVEGQKFMVDNVSAGGLALIAPDLPVQGLLDVMLHLPDGDPDCSIGLEILRAGERGLRHCRFVDLPANVENRLFRYVLEREKQVIRRGP